MEENNRVFRKIQKLLALSSSDNLNEAGTALRQANYLMEKHGLNATDLERSKSQVSDKYGARRPGWTKILSYACARAFGCSSFSGWEKIIFIGKGCAPELAKYAYDRVSVIAKTSIKGENNRKMFCAGVQESIEAFAKPYNLSESEKDADWLRKVENKYVQRQRRYVSFRRDSESIDAFNAGREVDIYTPVGARRQDRIGNGGN